MGRPGVLLDRDGVIMVDSGYVGHPDRVILIDGAAAAIARFNQANLPVVVVTNQSGVARGYFEITDVERVHRRLADLLAAHGARIDRFYFCPYYVDGTVPQFARHSWDRKPAPGMALAAAADFDLDLRRSWVVGDSDGDMQLAQAIGAVGIYVGVEACAVPKVLPRPSLAAAAEVILAGPVTSDNA